jgi:glycosyltransferase involved in cell wall biosynthesis
MVLIGCFVEPVPEVVYEYWPLARMGKAPVIVHLFRRLTRAFAASHDSTFVAFGPRSSRLASVEAAAMESGVAAYPCEAASILHCAAEIVAAMPLVKHVLLYPAASPFPDCELGMQMLASHLELGAEATFLSDRLFGVTPDILSAPLITTAAELQPTGTDVLSVRQIVEHMDVALRSAGHTGIRIHYHNLLLSEPRRSRLLPQSTVVTSRAALAAAADVAESRAAREGTLQEAERFREFLERRPLYPVVRAVAMDHRPSILFATDFAAHSGAEESLIDLIGHLDKRHWRPILLLPLECFTAERARGAGVEVVTLGNGLDTCHPDGISCFSDLLNKYTVRLLHINVFAGLTLPIMARLRRMPIVVHVRTLHAEQIPEWLHLADRIVAISELTRSNLIAKGARPATVQVVYNGFNLLEYAASSEDHEQQSAAKARMGFPADQKLVVLASRVTPQKRLEVFLHAMRILKEDDANVMGAICGEPGIRDHQYYCDLRSLHRQMDLGDNVRFIGFHRRVRDVYAAADAVVLCTDLEPFGRTVIEAAAMKVPAVVPYSGGHAEVLTDEVNCLKYVPGDAADCASKIARLIDDTALSARLGHAARVVAEGLNIERHVQQMTSLYQELLTTSATGASA